MFIQLLLGCGLLATNEVPHPTEHAGADGTTAVRESTEAPNVLVIVWDTVRADRTSIYGHGVDTTPRMKAWASKGVVYERAISPGIWTLPAHASMFSGLAVRTHGVGDGHKWLDDHVLTFAEILKERGYETFAWSANPLVSRKTNLLQGFDVAAHPWSKNVKDRALAMQVARDPAPDADGEIGHWSMSAVGPLGLRRFAAWRKARQGPWLGFINLMEAHATRTPTMEARAAVMTPTQVEQSLTFNQLPVTQHAWMVGARPWPDEDGMDIVRGVYDATLWDLDAMTADLLDMLDADGGLDNTMVVLVSDHGELLGEHEMVGHQLGVWSELTRVPLVVLHPGHLQPGRNQDLVSTAEIFGMILAATGASDHPGAEAGQRWQRREHGVVTEYEEAPAATLRMLREIDPSIEIDGHAQGRTALELGNTAYHHGSVDGWKAWDMAADPGQTVSTGQPTRGQEHLTAWQQTVPLFDPELADEVAEPVDQGAAQRALQVLGYAE